MFGKISWTHKTIVPCLTKIVKDATILANLEVLRNVSPQKLAGNGKMP